MVAHQTCISFKELSVENLIGTLTDSEKKYCPKQLYVTGDISLLSAGKRVSIIGSREASHKGLEAAYKLSIRLVKEGIYILSGLAKGIDTAAHKGAIESKGKTVAVIGTPLNVYYPKENQVLQDLIAREYLLISQFPIGSPTNKANFPIRNRTMALLSDATVIVEAKDGSGSLYQAREALRLGRPVWILESTATNPELKWVKDMLSYGAQILSKETLSQFLQYLSSIHRKELESVTF